MSAQIDIRELAISSGLVVVDEEFNTKVSGDMNQFNIFVRKLLSSQMSSSTEFTWARADQAHRESFRVPALAAPTPASYEDEMARKGAVRLLAKLESIANTLSSGYLAAGRVHRARNEIKDVISQVRSMFKL